MFRTSHPKRSPARLTPTRTLRCEPLEDRRLMTAVPFFTPYVEMSQLAQDTPTEATSLFLNFDGYSDEGVMAYESLDGTRHQDIQEILFRTSQNFAPFNVEVKRAWGNSNLWTSDGATTIFIGDKLSNTVYAVEGPDAGWVSNTAYASAEVDYPRLGDVLHEINSDPFNKGFVDPYSYNSDTGAESSWSPFQIADVVAHEAGHTFGLAHVLTDGGPDIMSYDSFSTQFQYAVHPVTTLNNNGATTESAPSLQPMWPVMQIVDGQWMMNFVNINQQNSYAVLEGVLGARWTGNDYANVADDDAVSGMYTDGEMPEATFGFSETGSIGRAGDYDVFSLSVGATSTVVIDVEAWGSSELDTVMVFDNSGNSLLEYDNDSGAGWDAKAAFQALERPTRWL